MKPTEEFVEERFRHFNALCFGGILPEVPVVLTSVKSYIGMCSYKKRRIGRGRYEYYDFKFRINTRIDLSESEWEDIILHEMIHYYIALNGLQDSSAHGPLFRKMMRFINGTYGRHITVTQRTSAVQREQLTGTKARERVVAMVSFRDGRTGLKVLPPDKRAVAAYRRGILRSPLPVTSCRRNWRGVNCSLRERPMKVMVTSITKGRTTENRITRGLKCASYGGRP